MPRCYDGAPMRARLLLILLGAACLATAGLRCSPAPEQPTENVVLGSVRLLDRFEAEPPDGDRESRRCPGVPAVPEGEPAMVTRDGSRRSVVTTCDGRWLRAAVEAPPGAVLDLALTGIDDPMDEEASVAEPADGKDTGAAAPEAVLRAIFHGAGEQERELLRTAPPADGWSSHRLELPVPAEGGEIELVLSSSGPGAVAWGALYLTAEGDSPRGKRSGGEGPPNLILISLDTVRADRLSLYGHRRPTSPNLERLAAEALVYEHSLSASTWTLPSTATLLTGLLPAQHGVTALGTRLTRDVTTLAERLAAAGYRTTAITDGGFVGFNWGFPQGFDRYDATHGSDWATKDAAGIFATAEAWVRDNRFEPFFLFVHTYESHQPYANREGFADPFLDPAYAGPIGDSVGIPPKSGPPGPADLERIGALYDGEIRRADHYLGRFLDSLRESGSWEDTAVVVTSDHGEELGEHGGMEHARGKVFDPNVLVPLVIKPAASGEIARARGPARVEAPVTGLDVVPTLLAMAGLPHPELPGRDLLATGGPEAARPFVHGIPSLPNSTAERFRWDPARGASIVYHRTANELLAYERDTGRVMPWDRHAAPKDGSVGAADADRGPVDRLTAVRAWLSPARFLVRLPAGATQADAPEGSRIVPTGVVRTPDAEADAGSARFLVFDLADGRGDWTVRWSGAGGDGGALELDLGPLRRSVRGRREGEDGGTAAPAPWNPLRDPLPDVGVVLSTAAGFTAAQAQVGDETRDELRALGYLD